MRIKTGNVNIENFIAIRPRFRIILAKHDDFSRIVTFHL